jgi:hypothetical protein
MLTSLAGRSDLETDRHHQLAPDVVLIDAHDGTARLIDLGGRFHALSAMAVTMLRAVLRSGVDTAAAEIAAEHRADPDLVRADLKQLLVTLTREGLIQDSARRQDRGGWLSRTLLTAFVAVLSGLRRLPLGRRRRASLFLGSAYLSFRFFGWRKTIAAWQRLRRNQLSDEPDDTAIRDIDEAVRQSAAAHLLPVACKERALCCWVLLGAAGIRSELVIGLTLYPLAGHCWCEARGCCLSDDPGPCEMFTPLIRY